MFPEPTQPNADLEPKIERFVLQAAHRLIALAIWLLAARAGLAIFSYDAGVAGKLLPWAMVFINAALVCEVATYLIARGLGRDRDEPRRMLTPTLILFCVTAAWMLLEIARAN
jgi:hypothetical protein